MKAVYFLATAAIVALSFNTSAASTFRLNSTDIPANLKLTQNRCLKRIWLQWRQYLPTTELAKSAS